MAVPVTDLCEVIDMKRKTSFDVKKFLRTHRIIKVDGGMNVLPFIKIKPSVMKPSSIVNKKHKGGH
jgi:hypothetical protein